MKMQKLKKRQILIVEKVQMNSHLRSILQDFEKSMSIINVYLWIHGVGFTEPFSWKKLQFVKWIISILISICFDGFTLYGIGCTFMKDFQRKDFFFSLLMTAQLFIRFQIYLNRRKMYHVFRKTVEISSRFAKIKALNLSQKVIAVLLLNDAVILGVIYILFASSYARYDFFQKTYDLVFMWSIVSSALSMYFCVIFHILTQLFREFKKICKEKASEIPYLFDTFNEITKLVEFVNSSFHNLILNLFLSSWWWLFHELFHLIFVPKKLYYSEIIFRLLESFLNIMRFGSVCFFASSMKNSASKIKGAIYDLPIKVMDWENIRLALKLRDTDIDFKLFNTISIDVSLIITSIGCFVTYGIFVATMNFT